MKLMTKITLTLIIISTIASACGDIFVNKADFHVEARSMEFGYKIANSSVIEQEQTNNIILNLDKITKRQVLSWEYKNSYVGHTDAWRPGVIAEGVSVSFLYTPGITSHPKMNKGFRVINYKTIFNMKGSHSDHTALMGLPAAFTPSSCFVRATVLLENIITPDNSIHAQMQAMETIGTIAPIGIDADNLDLWYVIKDLDNLVFYSKNTYFNQAPNKTTAYHPAGYEILDLKAINFDMTKKEYKTLSVQEIKKLKFLDMA